MQIGNVFDSIKILESKGSFLGLEVTEGKED